MPQMLPGKPVVKIPDMIVKVSDLESPLKAYICGSNRAKVEGGGKIPLGVFLSQQPAGPH